MTTNLKNMGLERQVAIGKSEALYVHLLQLPYLGKMAFSCALLPRPPDYLPFLLWGSFKGFLLWRDFPVSIPTMRCFCSGLQY